MPLDRDELVDMARGSKVTRSLTPAECEEYFSPTDLLSRA